MPSDGFLTRGNKIAMTVFTLFLMPFCGFGVFTASKAVGAFGHGDLKQAGFFALFALTFGGFGFGLFGVMIHGIGSTKRVNALKATHPNEPWRWREDWAQGCVHAATRSAMWQMWALAILWWLISAPSVYLALKHELMEKGNQTALVALLFPLAGVWLLWRAVYLTLEWRRFGDSVFHLDTVPGVIGGELRGTISATAAVDPQRALALKLTCVRRVTTGSGNSRSTTEYILWEEEQPQVHGYRSAGVTIPVAFQVPPECQQTDSHNPNDLILWRLTVREPNPGVDYLAQFEVPVFRTSESDRFAEQRASDGTNGRTATNERPDPSYQRPANSRIYVRSSPGGGREMIFAAARNPAAAIGLTVFLLIWMGAVWFWCSVKAPMVILIILGLFVPLLLYYVLNLWCGVTRVVVESDTVEVTSGLFGLGSMKRIPSTEVADVTTKIGMQAGDTPYYDLILITRSGRNVTAGDGIRDKREADYLLAQLREWLGRRVTVPGTEETGN